MSTRSDKLRARWANPEMRQRLVDGIKRAKNSKPKPAVKIISAQQGFPLNSLVTWYDEGERYGRIQKYEGENAFVIRPRYSKPIVEKVKVSLLKEVN